MAETFVEWCRKEILSLEEEIAAIELEGASYHTTRQGKTIDVTDYYLAENKRKLAELTEILRRAEESE